MKIIQIRKRKPNRIQQVLDDLPFGVRFIGTLDQFNEEYLRQQREVKDDFVQTEESIENGEIVVGLFALDVEQLTLVSLKRMRYVLPRDQYRRIKDRIAARITRRKRAEKTRRLQRFNEILLDENRRLHQMLRQRNHETIDTTPSGPLLMNHMSQKDHSHSKEPNHLQNTKWTDLPL